MTNITLTKEQEAIYKEKVKPTIEAVSEMVIRTNEDNISCQKLILEIKAQRKKVYEMFHPPVEAAHKAWKAAKELENFFVGPYDAAESSAKAKSSQFVISEENRVRRENERLEAERREKERKESEKLQAKADKEEAKGNVEQAETLREQSQQVFVAPTVVPVQEPERVKGVSYRDKWRGEVVDIYAFLQAIVEKRISPELVKIDQGKLDRLADTNKNLIAIPGVRTICDKIMAGRA